MTEKQSNAKKPLAFFAAINAILMVINTGFVTSKELMTVLACIIGPVSWFLAWHLERYLILRAPSSLEDAQAERAHNDLCREVKKILKDRTLPKEKRDEYESMLHDANMKKMQHLKHKQELALDDAASGKQTTILPPAD